MSETDQRVPRDLPESVHYDAKPESATTWLARMWRHYTGYGLSCVSQSKDGWVMKSAGMPPCWVAEKSVADRDEHAVAAAFQGFAAEQDEVINAAIDSRKPNESSPGNRLACAICAEAFVPSVAEWRGSPRCSHHFKTSAKAEGYAMDDVLRMLDEAEERRARKNPEPCAIPNCAKHDNVTRAARPTPWESPVRILDSDEGVTVDDPLHPVTPYQKHFGEPSPLDAFKRETDARQRLERQARKGDALDAAIEHAETAVREYEQARDRAALILDRLREIRDQA